MTIDINFQKDILLKDMETIQNRIANFDNHSLVIKGWALTLWSAITIFSLNLMKNEFIIISIIGLFVFWLFDGLYKFYQRPFIKRAKELKDYFQGIYFLTDNTTLKNQLDEKKHTLHHCHITFHFFLYYVESVLENNGRLQ